MPLPGPGSSRSPSRSPPRKKRRSRSRSRERARSRSRSRSPARISRANKQSDDEPIPGCRVEISDGIPRSNGDKTFRAEILIPRPDDPSRPQFKSGGVITLRGPSRVNERDAEDDGDALLKAASEKGMGALRQLQKKMKGDTVK
eukprot:gnl/TRDRNA2_/TRDRNA2_192804_c0_seq1.p1 gnl/TRDRNA2_/TRDRNA2_192804_c0~~gnl/TRDRNA2_/TRDRNA2_192804_c0_seq1.p1  ORF type:complete len:144 (-),score=6.52 gnl/TRDRNA2_/TRDRNA2_192804_c0_seq1:102-533(-)